MFKTLWYVPSLKRPLLTCLAAKSPFKSYISVLQLFHPTRTFAHGQRHHSCSAWSNRHGSTPTCMRDQNPPPPLTSMLNELFRVAAKLLKTTNFFQFWHVWWLNPHSYAKFHGCAHMFGGSKSLFYHHLPSKSTYIQCLFDMQVSWNRGTTSHHPF